MQSHHIIRIALYTEQPFVARGLAEVLRERPDFELAACPTTFVCALDCLRCVRPDVLLVHMISGISLSDLSELQSAADNCHIVLWGPKPGGEFAFQAMQTGVRSILPANMPVDEFLAALHSVDHGVLCFEKDLMESVLSQKKVTLTPRQGRIVALVAKGLKNKEIAACMGITEGTVKVYLYKLFKKLGLNDRLDMALYGLRNLFSGPSREFADDISTPRSLLVMVQKQSGPPVVH